MKVVDLIFPFIGNASANRKIRKKLRESEEHSENINTPLNQCKNPESVTEDALRAQYEDALKTKDKFEDKAKATIVTVTISVSLIMGASGLLNTVFSRYENQIIKWVCFVLFLYAVLSMILAAVMDIKVLSSENKVYIIPMDTSKEHLRTKYDLYAGRNWLHFLSLKVTIKQ